MLEEVELFINDDTVDVIGEVVEAETFIKDDTVEEMVANVEAVVFKIGDTKVSFESYE